MANFFGRKLGELRKKCGLSQKDLAAIMVRRGLDVTNQAISKWESGGSLPNAVQFLLVCDILGVVDISGVFLGKSSDMLKGLTEEGRARIIEFAGFIRDSGLYDEPNAPTPRGTRRRVLPVYNIDALTGAPTLYDITNFTPLEVGNEAPYSANFGIRITGYSMEPYYHDGQLVWIKQQSKLEHGEVGVFVYENKCCFKRLRDRVGGVRLQSLDSNYPDIIVTEPEKLITLGKAVEQLHED
ncbi:MAG: helix-turn-helix domain-containing protein [Oscillospiraceae bacterium]|jgi:transcriptional regulator with XRE-family HTH domain|nr:helix-turn-helix domain-containing protein [Oscillospiraceae bacterium]